MCRQAALNTVEKPHQLGEAGHLDEDDGGGVGPEGGDEGARADRVLGQQDHLLHGPPLLPQGLLLDLQVTAGQAKSAEIDNFGEKKNKKLCQGLKTVTQISLAFCKFLGYLKINVINLRPEKVSNFQ